MELFEQPVALALDFAAIGCAVGAVQSLPEGVWIAMSGRIWHPDKVRKNPAENRFEAC